MLVLGMPSQILKSLFHKYIILLHPLYHPFSGYIKEISHLWKMAGAFHQGRSSEMETMSVFANASVGTIIKTQNKMLFFSLCILPCDNPRTISQFLFFY